MSASEIDLTWTDNADNEIGFRIERAQLDINGNPGPYTVIAKALANTTTYTDYTTIPGWNYNYRVTAYNEAGDSQSNILLVTALPPADGADRPGLPPEDGGYWESYPRSCGNAACIGQPCSSNP